MTTAKTYLKHASAPYGKLFADTVVRFQVGFFAEGVCPDADSAFDRAVETAIRLLPAIKIKAQLA